MSKIYQTNFQNQKQTKQNKLTAEYIQLQQLLISQTHQLEQMVFHEVDQNPALEIDMQPINAEDLPIDENHSDVWDQDYDKPYDEYETGERINFTENLDRVEYDIAGCMERVAYDHLGDDQQGLDSILEHIDYYRLNGYWPDNEDIRLREDFQILQKSNSYTTLPTSRPTFEVIIVENCVQANVISNVGDYLKCRKGFGRYSNRAEKFIQRINDRTTFLNSLGTNVLEFLQADFFHQDNLKSALLHLLPIRAEDISNLCIKDLNLNFSFKLDKKFMSKISDITVQCEFGIYPFGFFLPSKRALLKQWVKDAKDNGINTIKDQCAWIKEQLYKRMKNWDPKDRRCDLIKPLLDAKVSDIKNVRKEIAKESINKTI